MQVCDGRALINLPASKVRCYSQPIATGMISWWHFHGCKLSGSLIQQNQKFNNPDNQPELAPKSEASVNSKNHRLISNGSIRIARESAFIQCRIANICTSEIRRVRN